MIIYHASDFTSVPGAIPATWTVACVTWLSASEDVLRLNAHANASRLGVGQDVARVHARRSHTNTSIRWIQCAARSAHERGL